MPDLSLLVDLSNFYSIRQQTAFNLVQIKHTALLLHDLFFYGVIFYIEHCLYTLKGSHVLQDLGKMKQSRFPNQEFN